MIYATTVIFDLDGTLLDTLDDLKNATNYAMREFGFSERTSDEVRTFVGNGVEHLIRLSVPENTPEEKIDECIALFKIFYLHNSQIKTKPYNGILDLLKNLKRKGFKIGVVSNKFDKAVKKLCKDYFYGLIDVAVGENDFTPKKPDPKGIFQIMDTLNADRAKTVIVGDSEVDIQTAKNAELYSVGVLWGFRDEQTLMAAGADELVDSPERLEFIL